jgi:hypothetical protein
MGASGWQYTSDGVAEMAVWIAGVGCGPGGVNWHWGRGDVFHAPGDEVADAAEGYSGRLRTRLTDWLRARNAYAE